MSVELILAVVVAWIVGAVLRGLMSAEVKGWVPVITRAVIRSAARRLPAGSRERYEEEWLAEMAQWEDRPLSSAVRACKLWLGASRVRSALAGVSDRVPILERVLAAFLLLSLLPVLALIAIAIRLESGGPVFYRRRYIRGGGQTVDRLKFRTMRWSAVAADLPRLVALPLQWETAEARAAARSPWDIGLWVAFLWEILTMPPPRTDDPRLTRVGKVLRQTSLDELPMLINVMRGEMTLPLMWRVIGNA